MNVTSYTVQRALQAKLDLAIITRLYPEIKASARHMMHGDDNYVILEHSVAAGEHEWKLFTHIRNSTECSQLTNRGHVEQWRKLDRLCPVWEIICIERTIKK